MNVRRGKTAFHLLSSDNPNASWLAYHTALLFTLAAFSDYQGSTAAEFTCSHNLCRCNSPFLFMNDTFSQPPTNHINQSAALAALRSLHCLSTRIVGGDVAQFAKPSLNNLARLHALNDEQVRWVRDWHQRYLESATTVEITCKYVFLKLGLTTLHRSVASAQLAIVEWLVAVLPELLLVPDLALTGFVDV
ncbi:unnamed protein product [Protopolystoma xenopodis]|uniref:Uncharacterized protein n=1 Tax=Protopolystoma xenopodis TaxID=117903 RepID=A0A448XCN2_9PLAT|nr:unnamed protein product [Protopolystoma xenopodis]